MNVVYGKPFPQRPVVKTVDLRLLEIITTSPLFKNKSTVTVINTENGVTNWIKVTK